jgi:hypothetical protein
MVLPSKIKVKLLRKKKKFINITFLFPINFRKKKNEI